jgi:hypothetical protein
VSLLHFNMHVDFGSNTFNRVILPSAEMEKSTYSYRNTF